MGCENCAYSEKRWILKCAVAVALACEFCFCFSGLVILERNFSSACLWCHFQPRFFVQRNKSTDEKAFRALIKMNNIYIHTFHVIKINKTRDYANLRLRAFDDYKFLTFLGVNNEKRYARTDPRKRLVFLFLISVEMRVLVWSPWALICFKRLSKGGNI